MELLVATVLLRPYVFLFLAAFLVAGVSDLGARRTLLFAALVWPLAWLAEFSSTRIGIPFGLYHYTEATRGQELFIADVPFMDSLSFTFLAYAAFCLARAVLAARAPSRAALAVASGVLMMLLDVVIDPVAVRGDRWFLGRIFYYPDGGLYFGVPLSNFAGWVVVGAAGVGAYLFAAGRPAPGGARPTRRDGRPRRVPGGSRRDGHGRHSLWGVALYYAVLAFNLAVTARIGEWGLVGVGVTAHAVTAGALWALSRSGEVRDLTSGEIQHV